MALFRDDEGKTEKATPQRLEEARNKGQVALSHEFVMGGTLLIAVLLLQRFGANLVGALQESLRRGLDVRLDHHHVAVGDIAGFWRESVTHLVPVGPWFVFFLLAFLGATLLTGYGQIGFRFTFETLGFKLERLDPVTNLKRLFQPAALNRTFLSLGKLTVLALVLWLVLRSRWQRFAMLYGVADFQSAVLVIAEAVLAVFFWISAAVLLLSAVDVAWQRFDHSRVLMMTKQEVEDERKRTDGDPFIKSKQRSARLALMRQRMMEAIPKADVVITNPTHFSVALKYDRANNRAPEVVAKGVDELALRIRELARQHDVPLMEDPPLARALYRAVKVGQEIPEKFYKAVAAVLSHVFRLRGEVA